MKLKKLIVIFLFILISKFSFSSNILENEFQVFSQLHSLSLLPSNAHLYERASAEEIQTKNWNNLAILPPEILLHIFFFVPENDIIQLSSVCNHFNNLANSDTLWKTIYYYYFTDKLDNANFKDYQRSLFDFFETIFKMNLKIDFQALEFDPNDKSIICIPKYGTILSPLIQKRIRIVKQKDFRFKVFLGEKFIWILNKLEPFLGRYFL